VRYDKKRGGGTDRPPTSDNRLERHTD